MTRPEDGLRARMRWVEIDHGAVARNVASVRKILGAAELWAVVKGDAYGHGAPEIARTALAAGAAGLAVSALSEGLELREAGVDGPLFIMNPALPDQADLYPKHSFIAGVADVEGAEALGRAAVQAGSPPVPIHVKVDTGLSRFGVQGDPMRLLRALHDVQGVEVQGIFSHFASADSPDLDSANAQLDAFERLLRQLQDSGLRPPKAHMCNSPGTFTVPRARLQMVRNGLSVYGMYSSPTVRERALELGVELRPALTLKARIAAVRRLPAGSPVGYGSTYVTERETTVATLPIGYSDGVSRNLSGKLHVLVQGRRRPLIGRICMNHVMVDAGDLPVDVGDVVTLLGRDGDEQVPAEEWANLLGTIAYEIVTMVGSRNPRVHLQDGRSAASAATRDGALGQGPT